jgi:hypothetical protein
VSATFFSTTQTWPTFSVDNAGSVGESAPADALYEFMLPIVGVVPAESVAAPVNPATPVFPVEMVVTFQYFVELMEITCKVRFSPVRVKASDVVESSNVSEPFALNVTAFDVESAAFFSTMQYAPMFCDANAGRVMVRAPELAL